MLSKQNPAFTRAKLLLICCAFLLQGAWAAFSGSGFFAEDSLAGDLDQADPLNGDDPTLVYHHHDLLGSVVALSNKDAEAVEYVRYTSFGKATFYEPDLTPVPELTSNYSNRHLYTGREHRREFLEGKDFRAKKLACVAARVSKDLQLLTPNDHSFYYYSPHLGRWTTTDPIGKKFQAGDINLYRYVGNSTTSWSWIDPYGLRGIKWYLDYVKYGAQSIFSTDTVDEYLDEVEENCTALKDGVSEGVEAIKNAPSDIQDLVDWVSSGEGIEFFHDLSTDSEFRSLVLESLGEEVASDFLNFAEDYLENTDETMCSLFGLLFVEQLSGGKLLRTLKTLKNLRRITPDAPKSADELVDLSSTARRNHILDGEIRSNGSYGGGHRPGTGFPNKSEIPSGWSDDQIMHHISDVATDPLSTTRAGRGGDVFM